LVVSPKSEQQPKSVDTKGMVRVTRHGTFMGFALIGLGSAITSTHLVPIVFWLGFPAFWIVGSLHQDYRKKLENIPQEFFEKTSLLPFKVSKQLFEAK
jgi:uncharacterized membrane protein